MKAPALAFRAVRHAYGRLTALNGLDLTVPEGEIYGFLGLNGAGKTTAIRLAAGLIRLQSGRIEILGETVGRGARRRIPPAARLAAGILFEDFGAYSYLSGRKHVELRARERGMAPRRARAEAAARLAEVGLQRWADARVREYSLGMRRRLGLACALLGAPRLVILDEPANGLDPQGMSDLRGLIRERNQSAGTTFLLSSHILSEVEQLCRWVGIVHGGRLLLEGAVAELERREGRRLRASPARRAEEVLRSGPWGDGLESSRLDGDAGPGLFTVKVAEADVPRLVRELVTAGVDVHEVAASGGGLEALFHRAVAAAGAGEGGARAAAS